MHMLAGVGLLMRHRRLLWATTLSDLRARYAGTVLGLAWPAIYPLLFLGLYAVVYTMIFRIRLGEATTTEYVLEIFAGLIPFLGFAESLSIGVGSVVSNNSLVKNTLFPIELVPVKAVLVATVTMLVGLGMLCSVLWLKGILHLSHLLTPIILILQLVFTIGLTWILAALNVFIRDLSHLVSVMVLLLMLVSPIAYTSDMVPAHLQPYMYINPLYFLITLYRSCLLDGTPTVVPFLVFAGIALTVFVIGYHVFAKLKEVFAEYV
jgi:lipopolysaccharide transport system permease protein